MESQSKKIILTIEKLIPLLDMSGYDNYCVFFKHNLQELNRPHVLHKIAGDILKIYGGMGTFGDVVLQQDGKVFMEENDEFGELSDNLYKVCKEAVIDARENRDSTA